MAAELNFGFWSNLFNKKYHVVWQKKKKVCRIFVNTRLDINTINKELEILRKFRNRVFHFETVYNHQLERCWGLLLKYISVMSPNNDFMKIINTYDHLKEQFEEKINLSTFLEVRILSIFNMDQIALKLESFVCNFYLDNRLKFS